MTTQPIADADETPRGAFDLHFDAADGRWRGLAIAPGSGPNPSAGPAGPAGVAVLGAGEVRFSLCYLTGRLEAASLPAELNPEEADVVAAMCGLPWSPPAHPADGDHTAMPVLAPPARDLVTKLARLAEDARAFPCPDDENAWSLLLLEHAAAMAALHGVHPSWIPADRVENALSVAVAGLPTDGIAIDPQRLPVLNTVMSQWERAFTNLPGDLEVLGSQLVGALDACRGRANSAVNTAEERQDVSLSPVRGASPEPPQPASGHPAMPAFLGGENEDTDEERFALPSFRGFQETPGQVLGNRFMPPYEAVDLGIDARKRGSVTVVDGDDRPHALAHWYTVEVDLGWEGEPLQSRWAVLRDEDDFTLGAGPLQVFGQQARGMIAVLDGNQHIASIDFRAHPVGEASRPPGGSVDLAVSRARLASAVDMISPERARGAWFDSAEAWLEIGLLFRAAWAWENAFWREPLPSDPTRILREALLATLSTGDVPPSGPRLRPAWCDAIVVAETDDDHA